MKARIPIFTASAKRALVFLALALGASIAQAQVPEQAMGILDNIVATFRGSSGDFLHNAITLAKTTFLILAAIELAWTGAQLALKQGELSDLVAGVFFKVLTLSFFFFIVLGMAPTWVPAIINSFMEAGREITGASVALTPTGIMRDGLRAAGSILTRDEGFWSRFISTVSDPGGAFLGALVAAIAALGIIVGFFIVAITMMVILIESFIVIGAGALMLAFSGSRWTTQIAEKYFAYAISVGVKLMTVFVIAGLGSVLASAIDQSLNSTPTLVESIAIGCIGLLYGMLGVKIPSLAGSMLSGAASMGFGDAAATAQKAVGGAAGAASMVAGATAGVAKLAAMALAAKTAGVGAIAGAAASGIGKAAGAVGGAANAGKSAFGAASGAAGGGRGGNQQGNGNGQVAGSPGASFTNGAVGGGGGGGFGGAGGSSSGASSSGGGSSSSSGASSGGSALSSSEQQSQSSQSSQSSAQGASSGGGSSSFDSGGASSGGGSSFDSGGAGGGSAGAGFANPASYGGGAGGGSGYGGGGGDGIDRTDPSKPMTMQQRIDASPAARRAQQIAKAADWLSRKSDRIARDNRTRINEGHTGAPPSIRFGDRD